MTPIMAEEVQEVPEIHMVADGAESGTSGACDGAQSTHADGVARTVAERELRAILESLLFVSTEPLSMARLVAVLGDVPKSEIMRAMRSLGQEFDQAGRGLKLAEIAGGYRLVTRQEYAPWIKRLDKAKSAAKLSRSALESLAIIAYKQPLVRSEIEEIRGVETSGVLRTLLERKLVRIVGRKEVPGRPIMYGTTKFFLEHFGLSDLSQLPPLREFKELGEEEQSLLPMEDIDISMPEREREVGEGESEVEASAHDPAARGTPDAGDSLKAEEERVGEPAEQV